MNVSAILLLRAEKPAGPSVTADFLPASLLTSRRRLNFTWHCSTMMLGVATCQSDSSYA